MSGLHVRERAKVRVSCPKCGGPTRPQSGSRAGCADVRCAFRFGYRIEVYPFDRPLGMAGEDGQPDVLVAVPLDADGELMRDAWVGWPPAVDRPRTKVQQ